MPKKESKGWISVADELPEENGTYIVRWEDGEISQGLFIPGNPFYNIAGIFFGESDERRVTHWQPYPCNPGVL